MSDITPPIGRIVDTSRQRCTYSPGDTESTTCPETATWHIAWDAGMENALACDPHMAVAQQWAYIDRHPIGPVCGMPGASWDFDNKRCFIDGLDNVTLALALHVSGKPKETER